MGCDIHFVVEKKVGEKWIGLVSTEAGYRPEAKRRNYNLFTELANVRAPSGYTGMFWPRFLPEGVSELSVYASTKYGCDGHSHSWLTLEEFCKAALKTKELIPQWELNIQYPAEYLFDIYPEEGEQFRIVFWFDN